MVNRLLVVKDIDTGELISLYIVDAHHHIGREPNIINTPDLSYRYYEKVGKYILNFFKNKSTSELKKDFKLIPQKIIPPPFKPDFFNLHKSWGRNNIGWIVDQTIVFPLNDTYASQTKPNFQKSNNIISSFSTTVPNSMRLIGFLRLNPHDKALAIQELHRSHFVLGLRGLKLHPISQMFVEEIDQEPTFSIVMEAVKLGLPIIFDARFISTAERIYSLAQKISEKLKDYADAFPPKLKLIIAHCARAFDNLSFFKKILSNDYLYGETSTLSGDDLPIFYENASSHIYSDIFSWSDKIIFGTDYPLMQEIQFIDHLLYLLSRNFFETTNATICDLQKILATNALKLLSPYHILHTGNSTLDKRKHNKVFVINNLNDFFNKLLIKVKDEKLNITSFDYMTSGDRCKLFFDLIMLGLLDNNKSHHNLLIRPSMDKKKYFAVSLPYEIVDSSNLLSDFLLNPCIYSYLEEETHQQVNSLEEM